MKTRHADKSAKRRAARITQPSLKSGKGLKLEQSVTIHRPVHEVYSFWRNLENLPRFMKDLESVTTREDGTSHWIMKTSLVKKLEWDARIVEERPDEMISWQSLENADVENAGSVWFTQAAEGQSTLVRVQMKYSPPGGKLAAVLARLSGQSAEKDLAENLAKFKALMEQDSEREADPGNV